MRSRKVSLIGMGDGPFVRFAGAAGPEPVAAPWRATGELMEAPPDAAGSPAIQSPAIRPPVIRGGFGLLGDSLTEADLRPAPGAP